MREWTNCPKVVKWHLWKKKKTGIKGESGLICGYNIPVNVNCKVMWYICIKLFLQCLFSHKGATPNIITMGFVSSQTLLLIDYKRTCNIWLWDNSPCSRNRGKVWNEDEYLLIVLLHKALCSLTWKIRMRILFTSCLWIIES